MDRHGQRRGFSDGQNDEMPDEFVTNGRSRRDFEWRDARSRSAYAREKAGYGPSWLRKGSRLIQSTGIFGVPLLVISPFG